MRSAATVLLLSAIFVTGAVASIGRGAARDGLIAFQRGVSSSPTAQIWTVRPGGSRERRLVSRQYEGVIRPEWSAGGKEIAFLSDDRPGQRAYVAAANGTNQRPLAPPTATEVYGVALSPNGKQVAFTGTVGTTTGLFLVPLGGAKAKLLVAAPRGTGVDAPAFAPNGRAITYTQSTFDPSTNQDPFTLWSIAPNGSHRHKLQSLGASFGFRADNIFGSSWSPNGRRIVAASATNRGSPGSNGAEIVVMNSDGSGLRTLTRAKGFNWYPAWSPDGKRIVFSSNRTGQFQLYTMNADGSKQARLTHDGHFDVAPSWQPLG